MHYLDNMGAGKVSNEFKVIDTQTGSDVTILRQWIMYASGTLGELRALANLKWEHHPVDPDRFKIRRSTGISDKNERLLFHKDSVLLYGQKYTIEQTDLGVWWVGRYCGLSSSLPVEYIEAES